MLRECGLTIEEITAKLYDRNHHAWCGPHHRLRSDLLLSITDWWNGQGGRTLQQYNSAWRFEHLPNPPAALPAAPVVPLLPLPSGVGVAPAAAAQDPVVRLAPLMPPALPAAGLVPAPVAVVPDPPVLEPVDPPVPSLVVIPVAAPADHCANVSSSGSSRGSDSGLVGFGRLGGGLAHGVNIVDEA